MAQEITTFERELSYLISNRAQITGWNEAIGWAAKEYGVRPLQINLMLRSASEYNVKADPGGRIPELEDFELERSGLIAPDVSTEREEV